MVTDAHASVLEARVSEETAERCWGQVKWTL